MIPTEQTEGRLAERAAAASCRSCDRKGLDPVLDLGDMPLSDRLITPKQLASEEEPRFPLDVAFCPDCALVQITETVAPEILFDAEYPYFSSFSTTLLEHSRDNAFDLIERRGLGGDSLVIELASNDGYLLKNFVERGVPVLGIDPAPGPAKAAEKIGVKTRNAFFTTDLANELKGEGVQADVIIGNNVLAHVADTNGFVSGIRTLLKDTGVAVIEAPYVKDLVDHTEFDTIYHEHLCYFSATAVDNLFRRHGLYLNEVKRLSIHGGSLRMYFEPVERVGESVKSLMAEEREAGLDTIDYYKDFAERVRGLTHKLHDMVMGFKSEGKSVAAYGAAAKGAIMLNAAGLASDVVEFCVDRNVHKQGKLMPGVHVPIEDPDVLAERCPDYTIILPWNFKDEIVGQQTAYTDKGGKFIVPVPWPEVL